MASPVTLSRLLTFLKPLYAIVSKIPMPLNQMPRLRLHRFLPTTSDPSCVYSCSATAALSTAISATAQPQLQPQLQKQHWAVQHHHAQQQLSCGDVNSISHGTAPSATTFATAAQPRAPATFRIHWSGSIYGKRCSHFFALSCDSHLGPRPHQCGFSDRDNGTVSTTACFIGDNTTSAADHLAVKLL